MIWGVLDNGTGKIHLDAEEQRKLHEAGRDEPTKVGKVVGDSRGYFRLEVVLTPIPDPYANQL